MSWDRLENYRIKTGKTWQQVGADIGLGKSMLMMVKTGRRDMSPKALYRLEQAEIEAGIKRPTGVKEEPGRYATRNDNAEMRRDLLGMKKDLAAMGKRVDWMLSRMEGGSDT